MKHNLLAYLVLITGLALSGVAAYYSIIGLTAIFAGAFWPVIIMGSILEIGKLVAVSWLYHNWKYVKWRVKSYFLTAIFVLMGITSMGIFGFLSRAHIEHQVSIETGAASGQSILDEQIKFKEEEIADVDKQIKVIDDSINKIIEKKSGTTALYASKEQKKNRADLVAQKNKLLEELKPMRIEKIKGDAEVKKLEAEVGPLKYVAQVIYEDSSNEVLDKAVRFVILLIIFVFDPLAVMLLLAFNITISRKHDYEQMEFLDMKLPKSFKEQKKTRSKKPSANTTSTLYNGGDF
jgi:hypothetical protein